MSDLTRINEPRVKKVVAMLAAIEKSAKWQRAHELDIARLLAPVAEKLDEMLDPDAVEMTRPKPGPVITQAPMQATVTPSTHAMRATLEGMSVKQLSDLLTMTAAQIDIKLNP